MSPQIVEEFERGIDCKEKLIFDHTFTITDVVINSFLVQTFLTQI
jgi:hypothetical protein